MSSLLNFVFKAYENHFYLFSQPTLLLVGAEKNLSNILKEQIELFMYIKTEEKKPPSQNR